MVVPLVLVDFEAIVTVGTDESRFTSFQEWPGRYLDSYSGTGGRSASSEPSVRSVYSL